MIIYPAIDIKDGQCVRLIQGKLNDKTVYSNNPSEAARSFQQQGAKWLHIVDLDGAFTGKPSNLEVVKRIADSIYIPFQVGGGLRTTEDVKKVLDTGASRVIIGTKAVTSPDFIEELLDKFGPDQVVLGIDAHQGMVKVEGWVADSEITAVELGLQMSHMGIKRAVFTDISRDGLLKGPNINAIQEMADKTRLQIIASGGVSSIQNIIELKELQDVGVEGAIIGKALYDRKVKLADVLAAAGN
ncbi:MAG: 1-(5-phosphoribosyl)-5-[(5-phosphoribosylamino)methylideneamino]imidazole-4-carboxamide isomerase [Syntrophomonadaceae bacterium]|jgi:phosphoribosylformimino-5-aminoimidazole carboxamide ribotide isomerase|nr:1-(5-phosphoribosyl)-5-[(5-phosphoribosylamino)methylideneamino]imidazole-4-carboxamide isomerase [Syntrophomonadaceae bacterium]